VPKNNPRRGATPAGYTPQRGVPQELNWGGGTFLKGKGVEPPLAKVSRGRPPISMEKGALATFGWGRLVIDSPPFLNPELAADIRG